MKARRKLKYPELVMPRGRFVLDERDRWLITKFLVSICFDRTDRPATNQHAVGLVQLGGGTEIFSALTAPRLCDTMGRYWNPFKLLMVVSAKRFYRFEHILALSSGKVVAKSTAGGLWLDIALFRYTEVFSAIRRLG